MADSTDDVSPGLPTISPAIPGRWVHSWEEDVGGIEVYRSGFDFPPAPRDAFETFRNGTVVLDEVDSAGATVQVRGRWQQPTIDRLAVSFPENHAAFTPQAVQDVEPGLLRARRLPEPNPTISPAIPGRWVHSWEEDVDGIEVYRSGFDFPPAPRDAFETFRNGTVVLDEVDSAGATVQVRGHWQQPTDDRLAVSFDDGEHAPFTLQAVADVEPFPGLLRVRRLPEPTLVPPATTT
jgi:hypothetical protein